MKINLIFKNLVLLISITAFLRGSFFVKSHKTDEDFENKYGVQLVLAR